MTTTTYKGLELQVTGSNSGTWGTVNNTSVLTVLDDYLGAVTTKALTNVNVTLSATEIKCGIVRLTGTLTGNVQVTSAAQGSYFVENLTTGSFTVTLTNGVAGVTIPQGRRYPVYADSTYGVRICAPDPIPTGTVCLFYQNAAPTGWTISAALNDYALRIVSSAGGVSGGTVNFSTLFARTATDSHTLTLSEIPSHTHAIATRLTGTGATQPLGGAGTTGSAVTDASGGGNGHTHDIDMRLKYADVILCTKDQ